MNIKKASPDDWKKFRDIRLTGMKSDPQAFGGDLTEEMGRQELEWRNRLESTDRFYFVMEDNDIFVSLAGGRDKGENVWMLMAVYTLPAFRGNGLAKKLVNQVIDECKNKGANMMTLMVNIDQKDAVKIYEDIGFKIVKTLKDEKMADGKLHDEYYMEMKLN